MIVRLKDNVVVITAETPEEQATSRIPSFTLDARFALGQAIIGT
jgi:hypothetical protein